jgi:hypothetical protein
MSRPEHRGSKLLLLDFAPDERMSDKPLISIASNERFLATLRAEAGLSPLPPLPEEMLEASAQPDRKKVLRLLRRRELRRLAKEAATKNA